MEQMKSSFEAYCDSIRSFSRFDEKMNAEAFKRLKNGENVENEIFCGNLFLVVSYINKRFYFKSEEDKYDFAMEGNVALLRAVRSFDITKGYTFSTFAVKYIMTSITEFYYRRYNPVSLPNKLKKRLRAIEWARKELISQGITPTNQKVADKLGLNISIVLGCLNVSNEVASLDEPLKNSKVEESGTLLDTLRDEQSVEDQALEAITNEHIRDVIDECLNEKEKMVVYNLFGFDGCAEKNCASIASDLSLTRQRVCQIRDESFRKLKLELGKCVRE